MVNSLEGDDAESLPSYVQFIGWVGGKEIIFCGGFAYKKNVILSNGHCLYARDQSKFKLKIGNTNANEGSIVEVDKIILHENYESNNPDSDEFDIGLVIPKNDIPESNLMEIYDEEITSEGPGIATGFAKHVLDGKNRPKLQISDESYIPLNERKFSSEADVLPGDSGSPMLIKKKGKVYALGILQGGGIEKTSDDVAASYIKLKYFIPWINEKSAANSE
uniref:Peptidase S1 domain-containing protein n=1 Tax=Panagrolaimus davidi TaxID=227884 RepID=A0A914PDN3_9BILA